VVSCSLQRLWVPVGLNDNLQTILINPCAKDNNVGDWHDMDDMADMLEDLEQKLEGLLPKHFSKKIVLLHEAMQHSLDDYSRSQYEDEEDDWGDEYGDCG
jgi:hypothetical protein